MIFKSLLVWLLLLAVPVQGFASVTMFACSPLSSTRVAAFSASAPEFGTYPAMADGAEHCAAMAKQPGVNTDTGKPGHHADTKCDSCASCHVGAALASSDSNLISPQSQQYSSIPFDLGFVAVVDLALPERPPQTHPA